MLPPSAPNASLFQILLNLPIDFSTYSKNFEFKNAILNIPKIVHYDCMIAKDFMKIHV